MSWCRHVSLPTDASSCPVYTSAISTCVQAPIPDPGFGPNIGLLYRHGCAPSCMALPDVCLNRIEVIDPAQRNLKQSDLAMLIS